jgi:hypothetical protein
MRMTGLTEITPWMLAADPDASRLADRLRASAAGACGRYLTAGCLEQVLNSLDQWYAENP